MQNNKSAETDRLTKEFYEDFWDEIKELFMSKWQSAV